MEVAEAGTFQNHHSPATIWHYKITLPPPPTRASTHTHTHTCTHSHTHAHTHRIKNCTKDYYVFFWNCTHHTKSFLCSSVEDSNCYFAMHTTTQALTAESRTGTTGTSRSTPFQRLAASSGSCRHTDVAKLCGWNVAVTLLLTLVCVCGSVCQLQVCYSMTVAHTLACYCKPFIAL